MREFTEKHHAYLVGTFYTLLTQRFGPRGEAAFIHATQRYAEQRGARMAQRAIRDGRELSFAAYREYGEWVNTRTVKEEGCDNQGYVCPMRRTLTSGDPVPWAAQFEEMGLKRCGSVYCTYVDSSVARASTRMLVYDVPQTIHEHDSSSRSCGARNSPRGRPFKSTGSTCGPLTSTAATCTRPSARLSLPSSARRDRRRPPRCSDSSHRPMAATWPTC